MTISPDYELKPVTDDVDWLSYHRIRREVLFEGRGRFNVYREDHSDEFEPLNLPFLLLFRKRPVATFRFDMDLDARIGIVRLMAVDLPEQRRGHGRAAMTLLIAFAKVKNFRLLEVNSAEDAVEFYQKLGFEMIDANCEAPLLRLGL